MKFPKIITILIFNDSRKVALGLWLLILATVLLFKGLIDADKWMLCVGLSVALVGGGTLGDGMLKLKTAQIAPPPPPETPHA